MLTNQPAIKMVVDVKVIPKSRRNFIKREGQRLKVYVTSAPEKGKANKALVQLLAAHFKVRKKDIRIIKGECAPFKTVEIATV